MSTSRRPRSKKKLEDTLPQPESWTGKITGVRLLLPPQPVKKTSATPTAPEPLNTAKDAPQLPPSDTAPVTPPDQEPSNTAKGTPQLTPSNATTSLTRTTSPSPSAPRKQAIRRDTKAWGIKRPASDSLSSGPHKVFSFAYGIDIFPTKFKKQITIMEDAAGREKLAEYEAEISKLKAENQTAGKRIAQLEADLKESRDREGQCQHSDCEAKLAECNEVRVLSSTRPPFSQIMHLQQYEVLEYQLATAETDLQNRVVQLNERDRAFEDCEKENEGLKNRLLQFEQANKESKKKEDSVEENPNLISVHEHHYHELVLAVQMGSQLTVSYLSAVYQCRVSVQYLSARLVRKVDLFVSSPSSPIEAMIITPLEHLATTQLTDTVPRTNEAQEQFKIPIRELKRFSHPETTFIRKVDLFASSPSSPIEAIIITPSEHLATQLTDTPATSSNAGSFGPVRDDYKVQHASPDVFGGKKVVDSMQEVQHSTHNDNVTIFGSRTALNKPFAFVCIRPIWTNQPKVFAATPSSPEDQSQGMSHRSYFPKYVTQIHESEFIVYFDCEKNLCMEAGACNAGSQLVSEKNERDATKDARPNTLALRGPAGMMPTPMDVWIDHYLIFRFKSGDKSVAAFGRRWTYLLRRAKNDPLARRLDLAHDSRPMVSPKARLEERPCQEHETWSDSVIARVHKIHIHQIVLEDLVTIPLRTTTLSGAQHRDPWATPAEELYRLVDGFHAPEPCCKPVTTSKKNEIVASAKGGRLELDYRRPVSNPCRSAYYSRFEVLAELSVAWRSALNLGRFFPGNILPCKGVRTYMSRPQANSIATDPAPEFWCPHCPTIGRMQATDTSLLVSEMERDFERKLAKQVKENSQPWRLHALFNVPLCSRKCLLCSRYVEHLSLAMAGVSVDEEWANWDEQSSDEDEEEEEKSVAKDEHNEVDADERGWAPPSRVTSSQKMKKMKKRTPQTSSFHTCTFSACSRVHGGVAKRIISLARIQLSSAKQREEALLEAYEMEKKIKTACALRDGYRDELQRIDPQQSRKRQTTGSAAEVADDPMTGVEETRPMQREPQHTELVDILQLVRQITQVSIDDDRRHPQSITHTTHRLRKKYPAATESPERLARWVQDTKCENLKGVPACGPDWVVDLRDARGHQVMMTLVPFDSHQRRPSTRVRHRNCFLAILRILIIPGQYAEIIQTGKVADVELSAIDLDLASKMDRLSADTVARHLAEKGLTLAIADDVWQFCVKFTEAEIKSSVSGYNRDTLLELLDRARTVATTAGEPPGICPKSQDMFTLPEIHA
ncbi:hypothetical protein B0H11DRAFT_1940515 [Mycena galericulata]|nr:hypothetical protein B0H11DRAFT_1940515 [Mycena galericulata]